MTDFKPMEHQLSAQNMMKNMESKGRGGFLSDACGLGKTITMSMYLITNKMMGKTDLVVCPYSVINTWKEWLTNLKNWDEVDRLTPRILVYHGPRRHHKNNNLYNYDFVITTYAIISTGELNRKSWGRVVLDESHYIKNGLQRKAPKCARAAYEISSNALSRFCVTGTPFNNRMKDLAAQALFIGTAPYNDPSWWRDKAEDEKCMMEWRKLFMIRRTKESMLKPIKYQDNYVNPAKKEEMLVNTLRSQAAEEYKAWKMAKRLKDNIERIKIQGKLLALIQRLRIVSNSYYSGEGAVDVDDVLSNNAKVEKMINDLDRLLDKDPKKGVVFFSQFTSFLEVFEQVIEEIIPGVEVMKFYGSMSIEERDKVVKRFNKLRTPRVILVSLMAGGVGLSLHHGSSTIMLAEPYYNPFAEQQAEERVHRLGQENQVHVYRYYMNNSVENWIHGLKQKKLTLAGGLNLVKKEVIPIDFNFDDIADLFKEHVSFILDDEDDNEGKKLEKISKL